MARNYFNIKEYGVLYPPALRLADVHAGIYPHTMHAMYGIASRAANEGLRLTSREEEKREEGMKKKKKTRNCSNSHSTFIPVYSTQLCNSKRVGLPLIPVDANGCTRVCVLLTIEI